MKFWSAEIEGGKMLPVRIGKLWTLHLTHIVLAHVKKTLPQRVQIGMIADKNITVMEELDLRDGRQLEVLWVINNDITLFHNLADDVVHLYGCKVRKHSHDHGYPFLKCFTILESLSVYYFNI